MVPKSLLPAGWFIATLALAHEAAALSRPVDVDSIACGRSPRRAVSSAALDRANVVTIAPLGELSTTRVHGKQKPGLSGDVVRAVVRSGFASFRTCYEAELRPCPNLSGRVNVHFTVERSGVVSTAKAESDLGSDALHKCVAGKFKELQFPSFDGPPLKVSYPIMFSPGG